MHAAIHFEGRSPPVGIVPFSLVRRRHTYTKLKNRPSFFFPDMLHITAADGCFREWRTHPAPREITRALIAKSGTRVPRTEIVYRSNHKEAAEGLRHAMFYHSPAFNSTTLIRKQWRA